MQIDISELTSQAQELLSQIHSGAELIITADNQPIAKIVSINGQATGQHKRRQAGLSNSVIWMSPDFNEPLEEFAEYM
jgi:antitoxin (DNA-binding transcriptional repressor) of toxin-antitoxin stability system